MEQLACSKNPQAWQIRNTRWMQIQQRPVGTSTSIITTYRYRTGYQGMDTNVHWQSTEGTVPVPVPNTKNISYLGGKYR